MVTIMAVFNYKIERKIKVSCNKNTFCGFSWITFACWNREYLFGEQGVPIDVVSVKSRLPGFQGRCKVKRSRKFPAPLGLS